MIIATVATFDGVKLYLDKKGRVTARDPNPIIAFMTRYDFDRLSLLTLRQLMYRKQQTQPNQATTKI